MTRCLLFQSNVPKRFWSDAVLTSTYLINRLLISLLKDKSPLDVLYNKKMEIRHFKIFGCTSFVHTKRIDKLDKGAVKTIFLGYSTKQKEYKCYDPTTNKTYVSRNVVFFEHDPYYKGQQTDYNASDLVPMPIPTTHINSRHEDFATEGEGDNLNTSITDPSIVEVPNTLIQPRRSGRVIQTSTKLRDFITNQVTYPIQDYLSYDKVKPNFVAFFTNLEESEPKTFHEANTS